MPGCFTTRLGWNFYITKSYVSRPRLPISLRCVATTCGSSTEQGMCCFESAATQHELNDNGSEATLKCSARWRLEFCAVSGGMRETLPRVLHAVRRCPSRMDNASCNVSCMKSGRISSESKPKEEQPFRHHFFQYPLQYLRNLAPENFPRNQSSFLPHRFFFTYLLPIWWRYKYNISISMNNRWIPKNLFRMLRVFKYGKNWSGWMFLVGEAWGKMIPPSHSPVNLINYPAIHTSHQQGDRRLPLCHGRAPQPPGSFGGSHCLFGDFGHGEVGVSRRWVYIERIKCYPPEV